MKSIWPILTEGNLNSVIAGISWAMVEPDEGKYNFDIVGAVINNARENNLKLIFYTIINNSVKSIKPYK